MGFVYEEISAEKGEELFNKYHFMQMKDTPVKPDRWVIDTERNAFLVGERAQRDDGSRIEDVYEPARALMIWNEPIEIEYFDIIDPHSGDKYFVDIYIKAIRVREQLGNRKDEVFTLVKDAILQKYIRYEDWMGNIRATYRIIEVPSSLALYHGEERDEYVV